MKIQKLPKKKLHKNVQDLYRGNYKTFLRDPKYWKYVHCSQIIYRIIALPACAKMTSLGCCLPTVGLSWMDSGLQREKANSMPGVKVMILRKN